MNARERRKTHSRHRIFLRRNRRSRRRGRPRILSSVVASQMDIHRKYGGVVPELASREHLRQIVPVVREALAQAESRSRTSTPSA